MFAPTVFLFPRKILNAFSKSIIIIFYFTNLSIALLNSSSMAVSPFSNRLARAIGHLQKVKQMVENGDDCSDVLIQLAAVKSALNNTGKVILKDHLDHCIVHAVEKGDTAMLDEFNKAIDKFVK